MQHPQPNPHISILTAINAHIEYNHDNQLPSIATAFVTTISLNAIVTAIAITVVTENVKVIIDAIFVDIVIPIIPNTILHMEDFFDEEQAAEYLAQDS